MAKKQELRSSLSAHEVIFPETRITIESPHSLDPEAAQSGIIVEGVRGHVHLSKSNRRATWVPQKPLAPGGYTLTVRELYTSAGERVEARLGVPFVVVESKAEIPDSRRIESFARLRLKPSGARKLPLGIPADGEYVDLLKVTDRKSGAPEQLAFNPQGEPLDFDEIRARTLQERMKEYGKLHESLYEHLEGVKESERVEVAIWLRAEELDEETLKRQEYEPDEMPEQAREFQSTLSKTREAFASELRREYETKEVREDSAAPVVYARLEREQIATIAQSDSVLALFLHEPEGIDDLEDSLAVANSDAVHAQGYEGTGVRVAVWENGPDDTSDLVIEAFYDPSQSKTSDHARHTHGIVKNDESGEPHGHAPDCDLYSANDKDLDALAWAVQDRHCTVISQSFHRSSEPGSSGLSYDDIYKDWLILHWPYPTILQAAGNYWNDDPDNIDPPSSEYVNHKGYNSLAVGNHNDDADDMSGSSVFRNPSTSHADRELPEICANGTSVTAVDLTKSGTSMAAPAAAGCTALLQEASPILKSWPEGCRAILLAGATTNVEGNTWWSDVIADVDASDGTGAVNAYESLRIAQSRRNRNASATKRGWDIGTLHEGDFESNGLSEFSYQVRVPESWFFGPRHVKVALAWNSKVEALELPFIDFELPLSSTLTLDFDLKVFDSAGHLVGYSGSWDNSYEIAEFDGSPGEVYTIRVRKWSGTGSSWYGIAWTVTGGLLFPIEILRVAALADLEL